MIRRLALTAGFAVLGAVAFAPKAHAQAAPVTDTVRFEATIGSVCTLTDTQPGTLAQAGDQLVSDPDLGGGGSGKITVNCTGGNEVSVAAPAEVSVPTGFTPIDLQSQLMQQDSTLVADSAGTTGSVSTDGSDVILDVDMQVISGSGFPPGTYEYDVEVTATPN